MHSQVGCAFAIFARHHGGVLMGHFGVENTYLKLSSHFIGPRCGVARSTVHHMARIEVQTQPLWSSKIWFRHREPSAFPLRGLPMGDDQGQDLHLVGMMKTLSSRSTQPCLVLCSWIWLDRWTGRMDSDSIWELSWLEFSSPKGFHSKFSIMPFDQTISLCFLDNHG